MKRLATLITVVAVAVSLFAGMETEAASKPVLSEKKMNITVGASKTLKVKKAKKTAEWSVVTGKGKVILKNKKKSSVQIVAKKAGRVEVQAKVGKEKLVCKITVKEKQEETPESSNKPQSTDTPATTSPTLTPPSSPTLTPPLSPTLTPPTPTSPSVIPPAGTESSDEQALRAFIAEQRAKGATISEDIHDPKEYTWDLSGEEAKLTGIYWEEKELQGELSFSAFSNLEMLTVDGSTEVTKVDVTGNPKLKSLLVTDTDIWETIDVSENLELEELECYFNYLSSLDVTNNKKLRVLDCSSNHIDELDLSQNTELEDLDCYSNSLMELDWTNNVKLKSLSCGNIGIREVDVSMLPELEYLDCVALKEITTLDVSTNHKLKILGCDACDMLSTLILNPEIEKIYIGGSPIKVIDASRCLTTPQVIAYEGQEYTLIPPTA